MTFSLLTVYVAYLGPTEDTLLEDQSAVNHFMGQNFTIA